MKKEKATTTVAYSRFLKSTHKDSNSLKQKEQVYRAFYEEFKTALEVSVEVEISFNNALRYIKELLREGLLVVCFKRACPLAEIDAVFYTAEEREEVGNEV